MVTVAKYNGKIVEIRRVAETVAFSKERGWICICADIGKMNSMAVKWIPASTVFDWVREYVS